MTTHTDTNIHTNSNAANSAIAHATGYRLPVSTRIRDVTLQVSDLTRSLNFYQHSLGFRPLSVTTDRVTLGAYNDDTVLITLIENRDGQRRSARQSLGLYHVAILLPTRGDLGRFLRHLNALGVRAGASDHLVSEALYLQDPDNLGLEIYADRPRATWRHDGNELLMATEPLNASDLIASGGTDAWRGMPAGTTIGHVHLHVGDLTEASRFYSDAIGLDRTVWSYPSALFLAAGGYHHHLGTNTWAGPDAQPATPTEPQLLEWVLELPSSGGVQSAAASLQKFGYTTEAAHNEPSIQTRDPWGTKLRIVAAPKSS